MRLTPLLLVILMPAIRLPAATGDRAIPAASAMEWIQRTSTCLLSDSPVPDAELQPGEVEGVKTSLWEKYRVELQADPVRGTEHKSRTLAFNGATMRYELARIGPRPDAGYSLYIALHGGGGAPAHVNDGGWRHMQVYYKESVRQGIYVAPRGVSNTWNLHFRDQSYPLYDRLIENMIVFEGVNPDRVYLLGFSAGGDGTYQATPRMADRWAAASMSAGHHNGVGPRNLYNVPFLIQVGERDAAYGRNRAAVEYFQSILGLQKAERGGYLADVYVHADKPHNFPDNDADGTPQAVIADPLAWLAGGKREIVKKNTNAINWLDTHTRSPWPRRVVWDLKTGADRGGRAADGTFLWTPPRGRSFYWLSVDGLTNDALDADEIVAAYDRAANSIRIENSANYLRILLNAHMVDFDKPVMLHVAGETLEGRAVPTLRNLVNTLRSRGDPRYMFEGALVLRKQDGQWRVDR